MRLGWLLEKNQQKWSVNEPVLKKLEKKRPESRILLIKKKAPRKLFSEKMEFNGS